MAITGRGGDIGTHLRAPVMAGGRSTTAFYSLVSEVAPDNIIVHYDTASRRIVGVSQAASGAFTEPIWWIAQGTYARQAGVGPSWLPGLVVPLRGYRELAKPVTFEQLNERRADIFEIRAQLRARHPGQTLHLPWIPSRNEMRTFPTYLAKLPAAMLGLLPEVSEAVADLTDDCRTATDPSGPEALQAEQDVMLAAGRPRSRSSRPGFQIDARAKGAVEAHALNVALAHYATWGEITSTTRNNLYDYTVTIDGTDWHVDVKGTTGTGEEIVFTPGEVAHARSGAAVSLCVVSGIRLTSNEAGGVTASGGSVSVCHPWQVDERRLTCIGHSYNTASA